MIEKIIENTTPYLGKMKLKFEKYPHYTSSQDGKLNKVHINLGFTKLVSRMKPKQVMEGYSNIDPEKIELIEKYTGGVIGTHKWGDDDEYDLENSFMTKDGQYIGNIDTAWWYYTDNLYVCREYPHGVALKLNNYVPDIIFHNAIKDEYENFVTEQIENGNVEGYYGYSHRGGGLFKIGDRIFDESYAPKEDDYEEWEWEGYRQKFMESYKKSDDFDQEWLFNDGVSSVIPFNKRGKDTVKNWMDARIAATNLSKYLG